MTVSKFLANTFVQQLGPVSAYIRLELSSLSYTFKQHFSSPSGVAPATLRLQEIRHVLQHVLPRVSLRPSFIDIEAGRIHGRWGGNLTLVTFHGTAESSEGKKSHMCFQTLPCQGAHIWTRTPKG